jgi:hypothetical protein
MRDRISMISLILPVAQTHLVQMGQDAIFQQDNARPHSARIVTNHFQQYQVNVMGYQACPRDLNPMHIQHIIYAHISTRTHIYTNTYVHVQNNSQSTNMLFAEVSHSLMLSTCDTS